MRSPSCAHASRSDASRARRATGPRARIVAAALTAVAIALAPAALADQQRDPELKAVVAKAIAEAACFTDQYDSAVWYTLMEPRLRPLVREKDERLDILHQVYCETHRAGEARLPPGLVMALIAVESRFDRWAVSSAGAVGLMQVMPFWPERLGMRRYELVHVAANIRMGCAILRYYLGYERNDVRKALARYNGSPGKRNYPDLVLTQWTRWAGADDLGFPKLPAAR
ncbi:MAG: lytic transglycosylase domain-containing protein [Gammaproteobacteria bacterium]|nr:lytic transglycosylase domain-containing protein [Gammaproteobacteria bacterium]